MLVQISVYRKFSVAIQTGEKIKNKKNFPQTKRAFQCKQGTYTKYTTSSISNQSIFLLLRHITESTIYIQVINSSSCQLDVYVPLGEIPNPIGLCDPVDLLVQHGEISSKKLLYFPTRFSNFLTQDISNNKMFNRGYPFVICGNSANALMSA